LNKHPLIGVWSVEIRLEGRPRREFATSVYHPDGSMSLSTSGYAAHGVWNATSPSAARIRAMAPLGPSEGQPGWQILEADVEVSQDGRSVSLRGVHSRPTPSGISNKTPIDGSGERLLPG
jgi:hypothetical protein